MSLALAPPPLQTPLVSIRPQPGSEPGLIVRTWHQWYLALTSRVEKAAYVVKSVALTLQDASIGTTSLLPSATAGVYRITYYARVTRAATTSSSLTVTIQFTDGGVVGTHTSTSLTGNTTSSFLSGSVVVRCDNASILSYATTYGSVGATSMQYSLDVNVEAL